MKHVTPTVALLVLACACGSPPSTNDRLPLDRAASAAPVQAPALQPPRFAKTMEINDASYVVFTDVVPAHWLSKDAHRVASGLRWTAIRKLDAARLPKSLRSLRDTVATVVTNGSRCRGRIGELSAAIVLEAPVLDDDAPTEEEARAELASHDWAAYPGFLIARLHGSCRRDFESVVVVGGEAPQPDRVGWNAAALEAEAVRRWRSSEGWAGVQEDLDSDLGSPGYPWDAGIEPVVQSLAGAGGSGVIVVSAAVPNPSGKRSAEREFAVTFTVRDGILGDEVSGFVEALDGLDVVLDLDRDGLPEAVLSTLNGFCVYTSKGDAYDEACVRSWPESWN